ncbi:MAG: 2TM domain-containing protein, partial [Desulfobacterales bacterium]
MENQEAYQRAKKRAEAKLGFYLHLAAYIVVNILLITGCSTVTEPPTGQLDVIETWTGYATGRGGDCSDAEVRVKILE